MSFKGAKINRLNGSLGRNVETDRAVCIIMGATKPADTVYNKAYELLDIATAEDLGITISNDDTSKELVHYHLSEIFRLAPENTYHLIMVEKTKTVAELVADNDLKTAIRSIDNVNVLGLAGISTLVANAETEAVALQGLVSAFEQEYLYIDGIFVEGVGGVAALPVADYPDLRALTAPSIHYMIGQDSAISGLKAENAKRAAVGTVLGSVLARKVHEDLGSVDIEEKPRARRGEENYSLSDDVLGYWLSTALSDGTGFETLSEAEQNSLTAKGWMYVGGFANYPGFYLNGCPGAVSKDSDYAYFNFNCIWNKAARIVRNTIIPRIRSKVPTDPTTGYLKSTWVSGVESLVKEALKPMVSAGNIEESDVYINPAQAVGEDSPLSIKAKLVTGQIVHEFDIDLGLTNKL